MSKLRKGIPSYDEYLQKYREKGFQLMAKGYSMYDQVMSKSEYEANYMALYNDHMAEKAEGKRKQVKRLDVLRDLVNDQAYQFTKKQALNQFRAAKKLGYKTNLFRLMVGDKELGNLIRERADVLESEGIDKKTIRLIISEEYYGSEKQGME